MIEFRITIYKNTHMSTNQIRNAKIIGMMLLAIHLFGTHSRLLYHINPEFGDGLKVGFSFLRISEQIIIAEIFALSYSVITAIILLLYSESNNRIWIVSIFAFLDGAGVFIYYNVEIKTLFVIFSSLYYSVYTMIVIMSIGLHSKIGNGQTWDLKMRDRAIYGLVEKGNTVSEISSILGVSQQSIIKILDKESGTNH